MHQTNPFLDVDLSEPRELDADLCFPAAGHLWKREEVDALIFAVAARRPLLVRGEAGCGKSQIARAAAAHCRVELVHEVIHPRFEALDLLYRFDVVSRLADSQVTGQLDKSNETYVHKGPLWRAMDLVTRGAPLPVLLIDEIDKADADVPNALLEVLGNRSFRVPQLDAPAGRTVSTSDGRMPIIILTTNEERELPAAFVRRCAVLNLNPPADDRMVVWLVERGRVHRHLKLDDDVLVEAAEQVVRDRCACRTAGYPTVGLAEYVDLLHALSELTADAAESTRAERQRAWLARLSPYALRKHPLQSQQARDSDGVAARDDQGEPE